MRDPSPEVLLESPERADDLVSARQLFHHHGGGSHHRRRHHEGVIGNLVDVDQRHGPVLANRLLGEQLAYVRVATPTSAEHCRADRQVLKVCLNYRSHDTPSHLQSDPAAFEVFGRDLTFGGAPARHHVLSSNCS